MTRIATVIAAILATHWLSSGSHDIVDPEKSSCSKMGAPHPCP